MLRRSPRRAGPGGCAHCTPLVYRVMPATTPKTGSGRLRIFRPQDSAVRERANGGRAPQLFGSATRPWKIGVGRELHDGAEFALLSRFMRRYGNSEGLDTN
jgi:hypothetical protein